MPKHLTSLADLSVADLHAILDTAIDLKARQKNGERPQLFPGYVVTQVFEKPSLRTRNSFEVAMANLGGTGIFLSTEEVGLNGRESLHDVATVLSSYADLITLRTFSQELIEQFAAISSVTLAETAVCSCSRSLGMFSSFCLADSR